MGKSIEILIDELQAELRAPPFEGTDMVRPNAVNTRFGIMIPINIKLLFIPTLMYCVTPGVVCLGFFFF